MVRITDTGENDLIEYAKANGPVVPKTSGYGAPTSSVVPDKAGPRYDVPNYTPSPGGLPTPQTPVQQVTSFASGLNPGGWFQDPTPYDLGLESRGYQSPLASPWLDEGPQTTQYVDPWVPQQEPSFLGGLGGSLKDFGSTALDVMDAPRRYVGAPLIGNTIAGWDDLLGGDIGGLGRINPIGGAAAAITNNQGSYETYEGYRDQLPVPLQVGADIAADPLTWLGPGLIKGAAAKVPGLAGSRMAGVLDSVLSQPTSVGVGQVLGGTGGAAAAEQFGLEGPAATAAILGGTLLGGLGAPSAARGLKNAPGAFDDAVMGLDARINEPAFSGMGQAVDEPMTFRTGRKADLPERTVVPDSQAFVASPEVKRIDDQIKALMERRDEVFRSGDSSSSADLADIENALGRLTKNRAAVLAKQPAASPQAMATERLWFHSTRDMKFDLPDPDIAVGSGKTGITQGPGIYLAADPKVSAGTYGPRTFVTEFDGKVLDLTKPTQVTEALFDGGPSWASIQAGMASRLDEIGMTDSAARVREAYGGSRFYDAAKGARAEFAKISPEGIPNGYVYKQALIDAIARSSDDSSMFWGWSGPNATSAEDILGRFAGVTGRTDSERAIIEAFVQNHLADSGVDALFHHSPRADGDVLIVLNGQSARVVADVKNAPDAVKQGSTLKDIRRGAAREIVSSVASRRVNTVEWGASEPGPFGSEARGIVRNAAGKAIGSVEETSSGWRVTVNDLTNSFRRKEQAVSWAKTGGKANVRRGTAIRTFRDVIDPETGAVDMGAFVDAGAVARRRILNSMADQATREGRPTGGIFDEILPTEKIETGLMRTYEGRTGNLGLQLQRDLDNGNKSLLDSKIGRRNGRLVQVQRTPEMEELFKALHGEGEVPFRLKHIFDDIKRMIAEETDATLKNNPDFVLKDDYFYRGWRAPKETRVGTAKGAMGSTPGYQKPRVDATFSELLAEGWEPISWNPYEMAALRRYAGVQFREQSRLIEALKETGLAVKVDAATPVGYRIPRVGPAFEGKPYAFIPETSGLDDAVGAKISQSTRYAVPDKVADQIENIFGRVPDTGALLNTLSRGGALTKRLKLVFSLFQQIDFATRQSAAGFAGAIDSLIAGEPLGAVKKLITVPTDTAKLVQANISGARQRAIRDAMLDPSPMFKERPGVSLKSISEAGWSSTDITIISSSIKRALDDMADAPTSGVRGAVAKVSGDGKITGAPARRLKALNLANERGLFEGVYPQAQMVALKKHIVPRLMRQHPDWTDAQISAAAATEVNKMFSTLGEFQQAVKNPISKKLLRSFVFSTNETESLLKQAASAVTGPNKLLWTEYFLGAYVFLAGVANLVHYATTGEPLPEDRYLPVGKDDWSPFGVGYNSKFMAPDIPIEGRGGTNVSIDLMGQLDTIFRLLDPKGFIEGRQNVIPRAVASQMSGEDFFGRDLKGPKERVGQLASDLFEPIGMSQIRGAMDVGPDGEGRLGNTGQAIQAAGPNLRAETNAQLKDRIAGEMFPGETWNSLSKTQRADVLRENPEYAQELITRRDEAAELGNEYAVDQKDVADLTERLTTEQKASDARLKSGEITYDQWVGDYYGRLDELGDIKGFIYKDNDIKPGDDKVLDGFYNALTEAKRPDGTYDRDIIEDFLNGLSAKDEAHVKKETGLIKLDTPEVRKFETARDRIEDAGWFERTDESWANVQAFYPELKKYDSYYDWQDERRNELVKAWTKEYGFSPEFARSEADKAIAEMQPATDYDFYAKQWREAWVEANPQAAYDAWKYGYYTPTNDYAEWLNALYQAGRVK